MARTRQIKPEFFENEELAECSPHARLLFIHLWQIADRRGVLKDRPRRIAASAFPYETVDGEALLTELAERGFIVRGKPGANPVLVVPNFAKHQHIHHREMASDLPSPELAPVKNRPSPTASASASASASAGGFVRAREDEPDGFAEVCEIAESVKCNPLSPSDVEKCRTIARVNSVERVNAAAKVCADKGKQSVAFLAGACDNLSPEELHPAPAPVTYVGMQPYQTPQQRQAKEAEEAAFMASLDAAAAEA
jgi:hypothetical protein